MKIAALLLVSVLPAILLWLYIWHKDPKKEPTPLLVKAVFYGIGILWIAGGIESFIGYSFWDMNNSKYTLWDTTTMAFFIAAIPEEGLKLLALWLIVRKNPYFDEHFDGIVYAVSVGLGFATMENIGYVVGGGDNWTTVAICRALLAVPGHYAFAILMGYYYSVYHFTSKSFSNGLMVILAPVLAHGVYDSFAMSSLVSPKVGAVGAILLIFFCIRMHKFAYKKILAQIEKDNNQDGNQII